MGGLRGGRCIVGKGAFPRDLLKNGVDERRGCTKYRGEGATWQSSVVRGDNKERTPQKKEEGWGEGMREKSLRITIKGNQRSKKKGKVEGNKGKKACLEGTGREAVEINRAQKVSGPGEKKVRVKKGVKMETKK